ncbi:MAG: glucosaminidase domain-containing protein [Flavisolibacter sp.]|jgi:LysM repeat protein
MKKLKLPITIIFALASRLIFAQSPEVIQKYIETYRDIAIAEELRTGVPAAITLAQGIHETGAGTSDLVLASNNHFGIKCKGWTGATVLHDDDTKGECFRKYDDPGQSYKDHSDFLKGRPYYASLFQLDPKDYIGWATGLKKAGYATNPKYAQILIRIIETYHLQDYTLIALGEKTPDSTDPLWAGTINGNRDATLGTPAVSRTIVNYPSGVFKINETRVIYIPQGTAYLKIADEYNLSLNRLFDFNDMKPAEISVKDELLYLQRKRKSGAVVFHVVQDGESLHDIAQLEGIRMESLAEYNLLRNDMQPAIGAQLYLQSKAPVMPPVDKTVQQSALGKEQAEQSLNTATILHTVQPKETVYAIAKKYEVAMEEVLKWNGLQNTDLKTGQQLRINKKTADATN